MARGTWNIACPGVERLQAKPLFEAEAFEHSGERADSGTPVDPCKRDECRRAGPYAVIADGLYQKSRQALPTGLLAHGDESYQADRPAKARHLTQTIGQDRNPHTHWNAVELSNPAIFGSLGFETPKSTAQCGIEQFRHGGQVG